MEKSNVARGLTFNDVSIRTTYANELFVWLKRKTYFDIRHSYIRPRSNQINRY